MQGAPAARAVENGVSLSCLHLTLVEYSQRRGEVCTGNVRSSPCPGLPTVKWLPLQFKATNSLHG